MNLKKEIKKIKNEELRSSIDHETVNIHLFTTHLNISVIII